MQNRETLSAGMIVRLTTPYLNARRGLYHVIYVYRNGWLGVESRRDGRRFDVPAYICRPVVTESPNSNGC